MSLCALEDFKKQNGVDAKDFDCARIVEGCRYPLLLSAGSMENKEEFFEKLKNNNPQKTEIVILNGCNHGNGMYKQTEIYQNAIKNFIENSIGG